MTSARDTHAAPLESVLAQDRTVVLGGLAGVSGLAWAYSISEATGIHWTDAHLPHASAWDTRVFAVVFIMWSVMMVAMMVPSASPVVLAYAALHRKQGTGQRPLGAVTAFVVGYVVVWTMFSAAATVAQWSLHRAALISAFGASTSAPFGGGLLVVAGVFQWTSLKSACLTHCRSPFLFFMTSWREGTAGAFKMGLEHGVFCLGCCWALMGLMFFAGVMNIYWLAGLSILVLVEKAVPSGVRLGKLAGAVMIGWGIYVVSHGV